MAQPNFPRPRPRPGLTAARTRLGLTQEQVAERLGVSPTSWARWEQGRQGVRPHARARMVEFFGVTPSEVEKWIEGEDPEPLPWLSGDAAPASLEATLEVSAELWRWDVDASRRRLLASLPFVPAFLSEWLLSWSLDPPDDTRAGGGSGPSVGSDDVQRINEARQAFAQMDHQFGAGLVRPTVVDYLHNQVAPLLRGRYSAKVGADLMSATASMTGLAGWQAYDLGREGLAQAQLGQALRLAKAARDPLMGIWVLTALTRQATDLRHPEWAVRLARAARHAAEQAHAAPRVQAFCLIREARAAGLGVAMGEGQDHTHRVEDLIGRAEAVFDRAKEGDDEPPWAWPWTAPELQAEIGCSWRLIGEYDRAARCAERAVQELGRRFPRSVQLNTVHRAEAALGNGDLDAAISLARLAVPMARTLSSRRCVAYVRAFDHSLDPYATEPRVLEWRDYLRTELREAS